jgi:hypothetical protein
MIPDEVVEAAARAIEKSLKTARITLESEDGYKPEARAAIAAALNAWPGMETLEWPLGADLILPLPQETSDE